MVVQGTYAGNFTYSGTEDFDLLLYGGYDAGCGSNVYNPELTVLDGDTNGDTNGDGLTLALSTTGTGGLHVEGFRVINGANSGDYGGCIQVYTDEGNVEIIGNLLNNCDADMGGGLAVDTISGSSWLINNIVYGNTADIGGGLAIWTTSGVITVLNNTFADNAATDKGGGIAVLLDNDAGSADVTNNIIWGNDAGTCGSDVYLDSDYDGSSTYGTVVLEYNDFDTASGICVTDPLFSIDASNINAVPDFVDPASGDYHISEFSPCIDEGDQTHLDIPAWDIDGDDRVSGVSVDIGANEVIVVQPVSFVTLSADKSSPADLATVGTVIFTAHANGDDTGGSYDYRFLVRDLATGLWSVVQEYGNGNTWSFDPTEPVSYIVQVWAKNAGSPVSYDAYQNVRFDVVGGTPVSFVTLSADETSPADLATVGLVTFTAHANGDDTGGSYDYRFLVRDLATGLWSVVQEYGNGNTWSFDPTEPVSYFVQVWAKNAGSPVSYDAYQNMRFDVVD
jgi:hypothetical protein